MRKPAEHLINLIKASVPYGPNYVLLLGAGASSQSGIKTARQMIEGWRKIYAEIHKNNGAKELSQQTWYKKGSEYSALFEELYDEPSQRREVIEQFVAKASPSIGYMYLVDLLEKGVFNTVFTTNFDDVLNEACYV